MSVKSRKVARSIQSAGGAVITTILAIVTLGIFALFTGAYFDVSGASDAIMTGLVWMHEAPPIWGLGLIVLVIALTIITCCLESIANNYNFKR